jgi:Rrf2 family protein
MMMMVLLAQAGEGGLVSVREMQAYGLPRSFLVKIARDLIAAKLVVAKEGRGGGYSLTKAPEKITLKAVVEAIEGPVATAGCLLHGRRCPLSERCPHRIVMGKLTDEIAVVLERYTVADFRTMKLAT